MTSNERWLPIAGWEGYYSVSDLGRVRSEARVVLYVTGKRQPVRQRILRQQAQKTGHKFVYLYRGGAGVNTLVHRAVHIAFGPPCPSERHQVAHNDSVPANNVATNLRWATCAENFADKVAAGTHNRGERHPHHKLTDEDVRSIRADSRQARVIASDYSIAWQTVYGIKSGANRKFA